MKIGRNDPCPCGSGKKYKKCCIGKPGVAINIHEGRIDFSSMLPKVIGFDDTPDLKRHIRKALFQHLFDQDLEPQKIINIAMEAYNAEIFEVNAKGEKPYGTMLHEAEEMLENKEYEKAIDLGERLLHIYQDSIEVKAIIETATFSLNKHPLQELFVKIQNTPLKQRKTNLEVFEKIFNRATLGTKERVFSMIRELYYNSKTMENRYAAVSMLNKIIMGYCIEFERSKLKEIEAFLIDTLQDDVGRIRNIAVYGISGIKTEVPCELFFKLYETAQNERIAEKRHTLCRGMLELVCPVLDMAMVNRDQNDYKKAIGFALQVTGRDPSYYKADPNEKIMIRFKDKMR